jgi:tetratricopeptide (TPR) repeat protein
MPRKLKRAAKRVEEADEFVSIVDRTKKGVVENWRLFAVGAVLVGLTVMAILVWMNSLERKERHAAFLLSQGVAKIKEGDSLAGGEATEAYHEGLRILRRVVDEYASAESGELGFLYLGKCLSRLKRYGEAIQEYERFLSLGKNNPLYRSLGLESLGFAYQNEKNYEKALACFRELAGMEGSFLRGESILAIGRIYEQMDQKEKAVEAYRDFLAQYPDSTESDRVQRRLALLQKQDG